MTPVIETQYVFTITAHIDPVVSAGDVGHGVRRIVPIIGGEVRGQVNGKVCPFGADFQIIRPNELIELEAKYALETDDGAVIYVENRGIRFGPVELLQRSSIGSSTDEYVGSDNREESRSSNHYAFRVFLPSSISFQNSWVLPRAWSSEPGSLLRKRKSRNVFLCRTR